MRTASSAGQPGPIQRLPRWLPPAAGVAVLVAATWAYTGYRYEAWPQPGFLSYVIRLSGQLKNDWYTGFPAPHWAVDHALALVPHSLLPAAIFVCWIAFLIVLWASFVAICDSLGAPLPVAIAAGLVAIPLKIDGFGASQVLFDFFYPNSLSFGLIIASLALLLRLRFGLAGVAVGLAVVIHPGLGPLGVAVIAPVALYQLLSTGKLDRGAAIRFAVPVLLLAIPPLLELMLDQTAGGQLTAHQQYEFLAIVREPHHLLYRAFLTGDYVRTALWLAAFAAATAALWRLREARAIAVLIGSALLLMAVGALASQHGSPLLLVTAQTSRLSALIPFLAPAVAAAMLCRFLGWGWATLALLVIFLAGPWAQGRLTSIAPDWESISAAEAIMVLLAMALAAAVLVGLAAEPGPRVRRALSGRTAVWLVAAGFAGACISLAVEHDSRLTPRPAVDAALRDVSSVAMHDTRPGELVMGSPNFDGQLVYSERPDVVEFGSVRLGQGDLEWRRRVIELTGDPHILDPGTFGSDVPARQDAIATGYRRTMANTPEPLCRYHARMVIVRRLHPQPPWLRPVYSNRLLTLYRVEPNACA